jgi:hypothetical protein
MNVSTKHAKLIREKNKLRLPKLKSGLLMAYKSRGWQQYLCQPTNYFRAAQKMPQKISFVISFCSLHSP